MKKLKSQVIELLAQKDIASFQSRLDDFPAKQILSPLFSALLNTTELVRWHAVSAMGRTVARIALQDVEQGRIVMRRLMWSLNDESGGIGWGAAESMGEIMALHEGLAQEFHSILFSYIVERDDGADNYLEYLPLRRGAFWGLARLSQARPELARKALENVRKAVRCESDLFIVACLCLYFRQTNEFSKELSMKVAQSVDTQVDIYWDQLLQSVALGRLCRL